MMSQALKTRREIEEDTRKDHILSIAERLFAQHGLIDTSMADIAKEAEFGVGTIYKYFKDKNTLIQSLLDARLGAHFDEIDAVLETSGSPEEIIERVIDAHLASVARRRLFFIIYYTHFHPGTIDGYSGYSGALDHTFMHNRKKKMLQSISTVFQKGAAVGRFVGLKSSYLTAALFGMFISFSFLDEHIVEGDWGLEEKQAALKQIFFEAVRRKTQTNKN